MRRLTEAALLALSTVCAVAPAAHAVDAIGIAPDPSHGTQLRVCADAGNLPFSNAAGEGFENAIAAYVATRLERELVYTWWPQRMGFVRNTLSAGKCDLIIGVPARYDRVLTTAPYYCSGYAAVSTPPTARDALDMERWSARRIGVVEQTPPLELLHRHDALGHAEVYPVIYDYDDYAPGAIVDAVARGELDLALLWGPRAGPLAARATAPLDVTLLPVTAPTAADLPLRFAIAMGVRRSDTAFAARLDELLVSDQAAIDAILDRHHVPRLPLAACGAAQKVAAPAHAGSMVKVAASKGGSEPATGPASGGNAGTTRQDAGARRDDDKAQQGAQVSGQRRDSDDGAAAGTGAQKAAADGGSTEDKPYRVENGKVDATTYQGWVRYSAFCERCHGPGALGSAAGPNLLDRLEGASQAHFEAIVKYGLEGDFGVMPAWQDNPNVMPYLDNLWAWLSARIDGALDAGRPGKLAAEQAATGEEESS